MSYATLNKILYFHFIKRVLSKLFQTNLYYVRQQYMRHRSNKHIEKPFQVNNYKIWYFRFVDIPIVYVFIFNLQYYS